ncbi:hypothetical protein G6O67_007339 [Ophiocordyceps sinensis]|uniref:mRNA-capping enzyme subunit alpha n=2 Tax=Ophiocordyceps sinensis TaxID=72228 RepID=A0A8H4LUY8_9HYPO|nr:mRNA capping enzyme [Ophiocordyceps sinensis CO18]KAF4505382.1 hypothetical protein G6O67_007339 [Ophiocordyceps sinensis]
MEQPPNGQITSIAEPGIKAEESLLYSLREEVAMLLGWKDPDRFPGAQPVSFARKHLDAMTQEDYYVCEKSDGIRYLLYLTNDRARGEVHYLIDRKNDYWFITNRNLHFPLVNDLNAFHTATLVDGELVWDTLANGTKQPRFLVFDCLVMDGNKLTDRTLDKRLAYFKERLFTPYEKLWTQFPNELQFQPFFVEMKTFQLGYGIDMMFKQVLPSLKHGNDGLIFTCRNTPYTHGTDQNILKWKPARENTIDFRLKLTFPTVEPDEWEREEGITEPFIDYDSVSPAKLLMFMGDKSPNRYEAFADLYLTEEEWETLKSLNDPLNDRIVECGQDEQGRWRLHRFRDDKTEANYRGTVKSVLKSIADSVSEEDLYRAAGRIRDSWKARQTRADQESSGGGRATPEEKTG